MSQVQGVKENPLTRAKIELGRQLYFDPRLSADVKVSCASCHNPDEGFARHTQFGIGIRDQAGGRNSPVSYNRILSGPQFWDGRAPSLEAQAIGPIANPIEMGHTHEACVACLAAVPGYKLQFDKIFGKLNIETVGDALASFERSIVTGPTPFDYYERFKPFEQLDPDDLKDDPETLAKYNAAKAAAEAHPLSESAKRGRELFFTDKANCTACHVGANLTDEKYHNLGVGMAVEKPDIGREDTTKDPKDRGAYKTPTIRNVALSAPYMHDGSQKTLEEVVEWYAKGGHANPNLDEKVKKLNLSDQDKKDLVEFMTQGCTGEFPKVARGRLPE
jgi:cytochrome c peroxidase